MVEMKRIFFSLFCLLFIHCYELVIMLNHYTAKGRRERIRTGRMERRDGGKQTKGKKEWNYCRKGRWVHIPSDFDALVHLYDNGLVEIVGIFMCFHGYSASFTSLLYHVEGKNS